MINRERPGNDDRGLSVTVGYIINLGVIGVAVTLTTLLIQGAVADVRANAAEESMSAIGQSLAGDIERVDTLASQRDGKMTVKTETDLPGLEGGYRIRVTHSPPTGGSINITSRSEEASVSVGFDNETEIRGATDGILIPGQTRESTEVAVRYNSSSDEVVIE